MLALADLTRLLNLGLALYIVAQSLRPPAIRWWLSLPIEERFQRLGSLALVVAVGWATAETIADRIPLASRVLTTTVALAWMSVGAHLFHRRLRKDTLVTSKTLAASTQEAHPWRATLRTVAAYVAVAAPALLIIIPIIQDELGPYLPDAWVAWLTGAAAVLAALIGAVTRIMAIPDVQRLLGLIGLGTGADAEPGHGRRADRDGVMDGRDTPSEG